MLYSCNNSYRSRELGHESLHSRIFFPSKLSPLHPLPVSRVVIGFNDNCHKLAKRRLCALPRGSPGDPTSLRFPSSHVYKKNSVKGTRVSVGFKLQCHSKTLTLPTRSSSINGKKKRYGGVLPSILKSLESGDDIDDALNSFCENLSPKEQTVILKEQRGWDRVIRVFQFFKSQKDYVPNVIHYNIVLRSLGRAKKWDELRRCWIEMARSGVLPTNNTYGMLVDVYGKAGLVKESLLWIKHMRHRGIFPDEVTMNTVIKVLKDAREFDRADKFYREWCSGQVELDGLDLDSMDDFESRSAPVSFKHFILTELFKMGGRTPPKIEYSSDGDGVVQKPRLTCTYNTLIDLYGKAGRLKDAADVFAEMLKSGVAMDTFTFNTMIYTCGSHGLLSEAESLLNKMEERGVSPDTKTYNIFLSLYAAAGDMDSALKCYQKIRDVGLFPDVVTHRAVLHILCERNMVREVDAVIKEMENSGRQIDEHSVPGIVKLYINEGSLDQAMNLYEKFQFNGLMSAKTRAAIIDAYAEKGLWTEAEVVFYGKRDLVGQKDVMEYNVMVKAYGKAKLYDKAFSLFKGMRKLGTWPDECTYNSLIQMLSGGDLANEARKLLAEMQEAGFKPQCLTFSSLIACYVRLGQVSDAVDVYKEMTRAGVRPNEVVYGSLINGFAETGNIEEALQYFHLLEECGIPANQIVLTSVIKAYSKVGCLEGAKQIYQKMKYMEGGPDIIASNSMISLYADLGMVAEAELIFDNLRKKGVADGVSFATMMYLYKNMGMLDEAIDVAEGMKESGLLSDCISYNKVLACYATNSQLRECGSLLHEMWSRKLLPDDKTFKTLFTVLKKGGLPVEAVTQLQSSYQEGKPFARQAVFSSVFSVVGLHALAVEFCETFLEAEIALSSFAYNVAIYAYSSVGEVDKALNIFMKMQDEGLEPDIVTYINLVHCYGRGGMIEGVKRVNSLLKHGEIEPNSSLIKAIMDAYQIAGRDDLAGLVEQEIKFASDSRRYSLSETEDKYGGSSFETEDE
ncbi:pentatricopeptide repeat-containing protein [Tripterygium wilfordii]|uniref:Pentatricopeptide repeat-containing protein n=1 Tax=Tripterygium wilfordii TaxID=458696 RepID=A0A7J7DI08_TRIWF|nr:pentatricopeptide repeat-containing protein At1g73710 [Tripterygium wilfordii]KAF5745987.1 pentatricopeptide repeat-containing protein [Tripterygium wilfordii]